MQRINVIGTSGSGKTTMACRLAQRLGVPHIEMDALFWGPNWTPVPEEVFRQRVVEALSGPAWTIDGNYRRLRTSVWERADTVVWLDYPLAVIMTQLMTRTLRRSLKGEELWNGNRESLSKTFFSRDSILLWALQTYRRRRREYPVLFAQPEYAHLTFIRLCSPKASARWLAAVQRAET
ncbi:MAG: AAA family ATPase [Anaerolineae bacterium]|jgi:adenylate kinase family enzyme|nr:AAA family ATPase [Anaerolineae bacterium]